MTCAGTTSLATAWNAIWLGSSQTGSVKRVMRRPSSPRYERAAPPQRSCSQARAAEECHEVVGGLGCINDGNRCIADIAGGSSKDANGPMELGPKATKAIHKSKYAKEAARKKTRTHPKRSKQARAKRSADPHKNSDSRRLFERSAQRGESSAVGIKKRFLVTFWRSKKLLRCREQPRHRP